MSTLQYVAKNVGVIEALKRLGIDLAEKTIVNVFGPPMAGKSTLSLLLARELGARTTVIACEPSYEEEPFIKFLNRVVGSDFKYDLRRVSSFAELLKTLREIREGIVIIDSLSALSDLEAQQWYERGVDTRVVAAKVIPLVRAATLRLRYLVNRFNGYGVIITHATSTAGSFKYRGRFDLRPSLAMRCGHYIDYELLLRITNGGYRELTVTASRTSPWIEGRSIKFRFKLGGIELIEKEAKEK